MYIVGKAPGAFSLGWDAGREPASCAGKQENSVALQAPSVTNCAYKCGNVRYRRYVAAEAAFDAWYLGFMVTWVSGESTVTDGD